MRKKKPNKTVRYTTRNKQKTPKTTIQGKESKIITTCFGEKDTALHNKVFK